MQRLPDDPAHIAAAACCKHFVANSMEHTKQPEGEDWNRCSFDAAVSSQDLVDSCEHATVTSSFRLHLVPFNW